MDRRYTFALVFAIVLDLLDYVGGWLPVVGDVLDLFGVVMLLVLLRNPVALVAAAEFIPLVDFLPMFTVAVVASRGYSRLIGGK